MLLINSVVQHAFEILEVPATTTLEALHKAPQYLYVVHSGIVSSLYYDNKGEEANTQLAGSGM
ncbi:MAG: hypothetical protein ACRBFS_06890 [Aureispira sp.]